MVGNYRGVHVYFGGRRKLKIETRTVMVALASLKSLERNARYMTAAQFDRLVDNIKRDGTLTSFPLVYKGEILSGNHRVKAAIAAGLTEAEIIEITSELTEQQRVAIALSHNAITGQDDKSVLQELYGLLDLDHKGYSGLTDDSFKMDEIDINSMSVGGLKYEELTLIFLPEDKIQFDELVKRIEAKSKNTKQVEVMVAALSDFDALFDAVTKAKKQLNIHNNALAMKAIAELALKALNDMEAKQMTNE